MTMDRCLYPWDATQVRRKWGKLDFKSLNIGAFQLSRWQSRIHMSLDLKLTGRSQEISRYSSRPSIFGWIQSMRCEYLWRHHTQSIPSWEHCLPGWLQLHWMRMPIVFLYWWRHVQSPGRIGQNSGFYAPRWEVESRSESRIGHWTCECNYLYISINCHFGSDFCYILLLWDNKNAEWSHDLSGPFFSRI